MRRNFSFVKTFTFAARMKIFLHLLVFVLLMASCNSHNDSEKLPGDFVNNPASLDKKSPTGKLPELTFDTAQFDFGKIAEGKVVSHIFRFTNTGEGNLVITDVRASCGCTTPSWTKDIIKPGERSEIEVKYNSEGRGGKFNKGVTIYSNAYPNTSVIRISGEVIPK